MSIFLSLWSLSFRMGKYGCRVARVIIRWKICTAASKTGCVVMRRFPKHRCLWQRNLNTDFSNQVHHGRTSQSRGFVAAYGAITSTRERPHCWILVPIWRRPLRDKWSSPQSERPSFLSDAYRAFAFQERSEKDAIEKSLLGM